MEDAKVTAGTIARTIVLILALANQAFALLGMPALGIEDATVYEVITLVTTIGTAVWAWWKNNSFTKEALEADAYKAKHEKEEVDG